MKVLIIAAHGSRKNESNLEIVSLARRISKKTKGSFDIVTHAFLQLANPLLENMMDTLIEKGATQIVIFPFFIGSGSHILVDIPNLMKNAQSTHRHVDFKITRHLGKIEAIEDVILHEVMAT